MCRPQVAAAVVQGGLVATGQVEHHQVEVDPVAAVGGEENPAWLGIHEVMEVGEVMGQRREQPTAVIQIEQGQLAALVTAAVVLDDHLSATRHEPRRPGRVVQGRQRPPGTVHSHKMDLPNPALVVPDEQIARRIHVEGHHGRQREQCRQHGPILTRRQARWTATWCSPAGDGSQERRALVDNAG
jgi:hypothetical protein